MGRPKGPHAWGVVGADGGRPRYWPRRRRNRRKLRGALHDQESTGTSRRGPDPGARRTRRCRSGVAGQSWRAAERRSSGNGRGVGGRNRATRAESAVGLVVRRALGGSPGTGLSAPVGAVGAVCSACASPCASLSSTSARRALPPSAGGWGAGRAAHAAAAPRGRPPGAPPGGRMPGRMPGEPRERHGPRTSGMPHSRRQQCRFARPPLPRITPTPSPKK